MVFTTRLQTAATSCMLSPLSTLASTHSSYQLQWIGRTPERHTNVQCICLQHSYCAEGLHFSAFIVCLQLKVTKDSEKELARAVASLDKESKSTHRSDADQLEETWARAYVNWAWFLYFLYISPYMILFLEIMIHCFPNVGWKLSEGRMLVWLPKFREWVPFQKVNVPITCRCVYIVCLCAYLLTM